MLEPFEAQGGRGNGISNLNLFREQGKRGKTFHCSSSAEPGLPSLCFNTLLISPAAEDAAHGMHRAPVGTWSQVLALLCSVPMPLPGRSEPPVPGQDPQQPGFSTGSLSYVPRAPHHPPDELHPGQLIPLLIFLVRPQVLHTQTSRAPGEEWHP